VKIGGFQSVTLSDFPGHIAATIFTQGCNFRCPFCHNGELIPVNVPISELLDEQVVLAGLGKRRKLLDGVVFTGGEPTLQPDLAEFMDKIQQMGLKIKLDTNGSRPDVLERLLVAGLLDYVAMDIKAPLSKPKYNKLTGFDCPLDKIEQSIRILSTSNIAVEFRTTFVSALLTRGDIDSIKSMLPSKCKHTVQEFISENALDQTLKTQG